MRRSSNWRVAAAARVPQRQNLKSLGRFYDAIVQIVANTSEVQAPNTRQRYISRASAKFGLDRNQRGGAVEILLERSRCLGAVDAPPLFGRANLLSSKGTDDNREWLAHS